MLYKHLIIFNKKYIQIYKFLKSPNFKKKSPNWVYIFKTKFGFNFNPANSSVIQSHELNSNMEAQRNSYLT